MSPSKQATDDASTESWPTSMPDAQPMGPRELCARAYLCLSHSMGRAHGLQTAHAYGQLWTTINAYQNAQGLTFDDVFDWCVTIAMEAAA